MKSFHLNSRLVDGYIYAGYTYKKVVSIVDEKTIRRNLSFFFLPFKKYLVFCNIYPQGYYGIPQGVKIPRGEYIRGGGTPNLVYKKYKFIVNRIYIESNEINLRSNEVVFWVFKN